MSTTTANHACHSGLKTGAKPQSQFQFRSTPAQSCLALKSNLQFAPECDAQTNTRALAVGQRF
jgi:hypothetical protein